MSFSYHTYHLSSESINLGQRVYESLTHFVQAQSRIRFKSKIILKLGDFIANLLHHCLLGIHGFS